MANEQDYKNYYLPFLSGNSFRSKHKRRAVPTAFVEFCDMGKPESTTEMPREYHNQFKPSSLCLPKIQPQCVRERHTHESDVFINKTIPLASNKVPFTFTEGLSAFSAPKPPLFPFKWNGVPPANLPNTIKPSEEKVKGPYAADRGITNDDTPRRTTLATKHIPLLKKDGTFKRAEPEMKSSECRPFLKFAPNVIYDKRPQKSQINLRSCTPYNKNKETKNIVVPKEISMTELDNVSWLRQKSFGNFYQHEINRLREKKSNNKLSTRCVLGPSRFSETKLELSFSVLREKRASQAMTKQSRVTLDINKSPDFSQGKEDSEACTTTRFVIKMPLVTDLHQNEISEVARLNANNSNNRESSFEIDECQSNSISENSDSKEVDGIRLLSIEPIDIGESTDPNNINKSLIDYVEKNSQSEHLSKKADIVSNDSTTELATDGNHSVRTFEENCSSNSADNELDQHNISDCIKQMDTESKQENVEYTPTDAINCIEGASKKLRLEVIVLKRTLSYREITTQMYYY